MLITENNFLITVICAENVVSHLTDNIRKFDPVNYTIEKVNAGKEGAEPGDGCRVQILCKRNMYTKIMTYLQQYYVKDFGVILYMQEVNVPM